MYAVADISGADTNTNGFAYISATVSTTNTTSISIGSIIPSSYYFYNENDVEYSLM